MPDHYKLWVVILLLGLSTYAIRASFIIPAGNTLKGGIAGQLIKHIPAAVLAALIAPEWLLNPGHHGGFSDPGKIIAGLFAIIVAHVTKNAALTIATGMGAIWILKGLL